MNDTYTIDLDLPKLILHCSGVNRVSWRVSPSGKGFHLRWHCDIRDCIDCARIEHDNDDRLRYQRDNERKIWQRRVLWDSKGGRKAGTWHHITRSNVTKVVARKKH